MNSNFQLVSMGLAATTALTAGFFGYLYGKKQSVYLRPWAVAWFLIALRALVVAMAPPALGPSTWAWLLNSLLLKFAGLAFLWSAWEFGRTPPSFKLLGGSAAVLATWSIAADFFRAPIPSSYGTTIVLLWAGCVFFLNGRRKKSLAEQLMAVGFLVWAPIPVIGKHLGDSSATGQYSLALLAGAPQLFIACMMLMVTYEQEQTSTESNLLALSNLNLATSGLLGGEMPMMLSQVLDSVLSTMRMPAGVLLLHHGDSRGPTSSISAGLDESFCRKVQDGLDDYLVQLPIQLNDTAVVCNLANDTTDPAVPQDADYQQFRGLAASLGLRTVLIAALQTKEKNYGALLLASPSSRRLSVAELSLSKELGRQIAMAIENCYLVQQTWRRSEELRALNEIGCALSSMLDTDGLLEKIFSEVQRLFNPGNFYVALYDSARGELRFELEAAEGVRLPKRSRPIGSHVTEYILRTSRPLLIRENFEETVRKLGVQAPTPQSGSFCGVPLTVYDRTIGVMAVRSPQERLFDEGHLEILRVLASEASIALENARLFREEKTRSRHLTLLNNISRSAITTLNPEEMLVDIAELLHKGLTFDHMGIAILDYASKEVVVQAEAGRRRGALNRRMALNESFVGRVARTGRTNIVPDFTEEDDNCSVLEGSASGVALPILYADQLLGVLYVETAAPASFSDEDLLLLNTLADLIAGALHNALTFQKAQEQAITDGLTGVKTHRFFMDALSAEWKRCTRAGRPFTLALIDVDRFKFINDFQGHLEGDVVLKRLGQLFEQGCRSSDVVARYGGDEFVILMPETDAQQGLLLSEKLRSALLADRMLQEKNITASFGLASFPAHGSTPQELIQIADAAMYLSKHQGGNAVSCADSLDTSEPKQWKRDVLETYLGVTLKRLFATGPEAFQEIRERLEQLWQSLAATEKVAADPGYQIGRDTAPLPMPSGAVIETVTTLALAVDAKDPYTQGHSQKVSDYSVLLAEELGLRLEEVEAIRLGGLLHDVGKVGIPAAILAKSGPLNADEWEAMKEHAPLGDRLLEPLQSIAHIRRMIRHHHEMFDGSGYPDRLSGQQIPLGARIISIADAYDTITSNRTYNKARTPAEALTELKRCAGAQFDPDLVRLFVELSERHLTSAPILAQPAAG